MIIADSAVAVSSLILCLSFFFTVPPLIFIYFILFIRALGETFHKPAMQAAIPQLVPENQLTKAGVTLSSIKIAKHTVASKE